MPLARIHLTRALPNTIFAATAGFTHFIDRDRTQMVMISISAVWTIIRSIGSRLVLLTVPIGKHRSMRSRDGTANDRQTILSTPSSRRHPKIGILNWNAWFLLQLKIDYLPTRFVTRRGTKLHRQAKQARYRSIGIAHPRVMSIEITTDQLSITFRNNYLRRTIALGVQLVERIVNFKPNPVGMRVLAIPFAIPQTPIPAGLQMHQLASFWVSFKCPMSRAQVSISQCECGNGLPTMRTLNLWAENGILKGKIHVRVHGNRFPCRDGRDSRCF
jgi:hypothetical protein